MQTLADWLHWRRFHADGGCTATIGYPYFVFNEMPVEATLEADAAGPLSAVRERLADTMKVIQDINDRLDRQERQRRRQHRADPEPPGLPD